MSPSTSSVQVLAIFILFFHVQLVKVMVINVKRSGAKHGERDVETLYSRFMQLSPLKVSYYGVYPAGTSSCTLDPMPPLINQNKWTLAAVSKEDFLGSLICGTCLRISTIDLTRKEDPDDIYAAVVDQCNDCQKGEISLYMEGRITRKANYVAIDCTGGGSSEVTLKMRIQRISNSTVKFQMRNSLLPVVSLEFFQNGKWICLPRSDDNYFVIDEFEPQNPLQFRVASITGEKIGFSIDSVQNDDEKDIKHQFKSFHKATRIDTKPIKACLAGRNLTGSSHAGIFMQRSKAARKENKGNTHHGAQIDDMTNLKYIKVNATKATNMTQLSMNESFCKGKSDGSYLNESDCEKFVLCVQGKTLSKKCPNGLRYNGREGVCDWPRNVDCIQGKGWTEKTLTEESMLPGEADDDVYTKRFMRFMG